MEQLTLASQVYCDNDASEVCYYTWVRNSTVQVLSMQTYSGHKQRQNGVCSDDKSVSLIATDTNLLASQSEYFQYLIQILSALAASELLKRNALTEWQASPVVLSFRIINSVGKRKDFESTRTSQNNNVIFSLLKMCSVF